MEFLKIKSLNEYKKVRNRDRKYLTGAHLKYIAIFVMALSHLAQSNFVYSLGVNYWLLADLFVFIGRIAMPLFCFFTVQAIIYTSDYKKYFLRMLIFAIVSEIPFDLAFHGNPFYLSSQNVIFTLLIGGLVIFLIDQISRTNKSFALKFVESTLVILAGAFLATFLKTDYSYKGVIAIALLYLGRYNRFLTCLAILIGFLFEFQVWGAVIPKSYGFVYLSIPLLMLYNGKKGKQNKWAFYIFYPAHLLVIYMLKLLIL